MRKIKTPSERDTDKLRDTQIKRRRPSIEGGIGWNCVATSQQYSDPPEVKRDKEAFSFRAFRQSMALPTLQVCIY